MTVVVDSSLVAAALTGQSDHGNWAEGILGSDELAAPHHMPVEVASILRRAVLVRDLSQEEAAIAHAELVAMRFQLHDYASLAPRIWQLRGAVTPYDAWYVALAEALDAPLATLDLRLTRAPGPQCRFVTP